MDDGSVTKISRRQLLTVPAMFGAGAALGRQNARAAPRLRNRLSDRFQESEELTFALTTSDRLAIQPLLDSYTSDTGTEIKTVVSDYGNLYTNLNINLTQATGAYDVVSLDDPWIPRFGGERFLVNITKLMDKSGDSISTDFVPNLLSLGAFPADSGLWAIPWMGNIQFFAWRSDVLDELGAEAPANWDGVVELATRITTEKSGSGLYGIGVRGQSGNPAATGFLPLLRGFGKDLIDPKSSEPQLQTPEAYAAIKALFELTQQAPPGVDKVDHSKTSSNLCSGAIAMSADIWTDQLLKAYDPEISEVVGSVQAGPEPAERGIRRANLTGNWLLGIPESSKNKELALEFILWITAPKQQTKLMLDHHVPPTRTSVLTDSAAVERFPFLSDVLSAARNARSRTRTPYYRAMEEILGRYVVEAIAGKRSGTDAMRSANSDIRKLLVREGVLS